MTCKGFAEETASESPAPGGGSIAAYGSAGRSLGTMVANLSSHKAVTTAGEFSDWADRGQALLGELLHLVDEDTAAFNRIMAVFAMPKSTDEEKAARSAALQATPMRRRCPCGRRRRPSGFRNRVYMAAVGNPNSVSDAGVGALAARSASGRRPHCLDQCRRAERPCRGRCARGRRPTALRPRPAERGAEIAGKI